MHLRSAGAGGPSFGRVWPHETSQMWRVLEHGVGANASRAMTPPSKSEGA